MKLQRIQCTLNNEQLLELLELLPDASQANRQSCSNSSELKVLRLGAWLTLPLSTVLQADSASVSTVWPLN